MTRDIARIGAAIHSPAIATTRAAPRAAERRRPRRSRRRFAVHVATPGGVAPTPDPSSGTRDGGAALRREFAGLRAPLVLEGVAPAALDAAPYAAVVTG